MSSFHVALAAGYKFYTHSLKTNMQFHPLSKYHAANSVQFILIGAAIAIHKRSAQARRDEFLRLICLVLAAHAPRLCLARLLLALQYTPSLI
jgi:hypothetical protein